MICLSYRNILNKKRFYSLIKYRKVIKRKPKRVFTLLRAKFKAALFKDLKKKVFVTNIFRKPTRKFRIVPRSFFFKSKISLKNIYSKALYLYFASPNYSNAIFGEFRRCREGEGLCVHVSRHLNLSDVSFFDDFFDDFYFGYLTKIRKSGSSSSFSIRQGVYDVSIIHNFFVMSPSIIKLERL